MQTSNLHFDPTSSTYIICNHGIFKIKSVDFWSVSAYFWSSIKFRENKKTDDFSSRWENADDLRQ